MFSFPSSLSPIGRMRSSGCKIRSDGSSQSMATSPKGTTLSPQRNGDYEVLKRSVDEQRKVVHEARSVLAACLDRLGEHHVRNKEYDDAMDAFTEALHEKRSVFSPFMPSFSPSTPNSFTPSRSRTSSNGDSLFDIDGGAAEGHGDKLGKEDQNVDEIIKTLRNMGNVHSLRGEQDEAMRYYSEVTSLRATKVANRDAMSVDSKSRSSFSGMWGDEDNSTLMSEINEDVKALDDLFRSISFRAQEAGSEKASTTRSNALKTTNENVRKRRRRSDVIGDESMENEPFKRSSSLGSHDKAIFSTSNCEIDHALDTYRYVLDSYQGQHIDEHYEQLNSFVLRADLMENARSESTSLKEELKLALEVYKHILKAQKESRNSPIQDTDDEPQASSNMASTLIRMGSLYYKLNDVEKELKMYREARNVYEMSYGENHPFVAGTMKNIGMVLAERGEYQEAMDQFEKARLIYLHENGGNENSRDVASAVSCMGNVNNRMGELDAALTHYMQALRIYTTLREVEEKATDGASLPDSLSTDVAATLKIIGVVHAKKGDLQRAMENYTSALNLLKSFEIENSDIGKEMTASILTRIAGLNFKQGEFDTAMKHYRQAYDLTVELRGMNHPDVASILHYMGGIHHKHRDYSEAMACYQEAVRIYHATLGPGHPAVAATLVCIGSIHYKQRNLDSAMMFYREALRLNRDAYGLHHPDVAPTLKSIGTILTKKGEYDEAYDVFRDVLSIRSTVHGMGHPEVANAYKSLGNVHYKRGELADAERQYRHALNIYRRAKGEDHPDTVSARTSIEHIRYWMKERGQRDLLERRNSKNGKRDQSCAGRYDERSC